MERAHFAPHSVPVAGFSGEVLSFAGSGVIGTILHVVVVVALARGHIHTRCGRAAGKFHTNLSCSVAGRLRPQ
jgi:hypothetical protein